MHACLSHTTPRLTRSHKANDRDHVGLVNGTASSEEHLPRYFTKTGYVNTDPQGTKKKGFGKGNWGKQGDELEDYNYNPTKPRRRSNSFSAAAGHSHLKTKFETVEHEPVFEEELHGPIHDDVTGVAAAVPVVRGGREVGRTDEDTAAEYDLEQQSTRSSAGSASVIGEEEVGKVSF